MTRTTLDEFINAPVPKGTTVDLSRDGAWICFNEKSITLDGEFTPHELMRIIAGFYGERPKE